MRYSANNIYNFKPLLESKIKDFLSNSDIAKKAGVSRDVVRNFFISVAEGKLIRNVNNGLKIARAMGFSDEYIQEKIILKKVA